MVLKKKKNHKIQKTQELYHLTKHTFIKKDTINQQKVCKDLQENIYIFIQKALKLTPKFVLCVKGIIKVKYIR